MANGFKVAKRETLTLAQGASGKPMRVADDYVEIAAAAPAAAPVPRAPGYVPMTHAQLVFERRMDNWARTVRSWGRGSGSTCAAWAALYVASRARQSSADDTGPLRAHVTVDELDGWLVEAAVRSLGDFNEKQVLRFRYVFQYPDHWIRTKLMLRAGAVRIICARAEKNLQQVLAKLESAATILSNNSHAGVDPRPESTDALVGAALTLTNTEALID